MIESIEFKNFKALRDATLPLGPLTILIGPNGSGKSTVLQALEEVRRAAIPRDELAQMDQQEQMQAMQAGLSYHQLQPKTFTEIASFQVRGEKNTKASVQLNCSDYPPATGYKLHWTSNERKGGIVAPGDIEESLWLALVKVISRIRVFSLDAKQIAGACNVRKGKVELANDGAGLAAVLDAMRDDAREQFNAIESQISEWLPEFDSIQFDRPQDGSKSIALRTREGHYKVPAADLSQGTLISLALLTLAYHPSPPSLIALEEPDRGIHPYLLRRVKDALVRLSHPESCGEDREPVQVIATTHSPYFVDLFRETPESIVVADKTGLDVQFRRLVDQPQFHEILGQAALGDAWFSGVLGGVPSGS